MTINLAAGFTSTPKLVTGTINGISSDIGGTMPLNSVYYTSLGSVGFQSDNGETWTNMPAALTEIYGNTNHEATFSQNIPIEIPPTGIGSQLMGAFSATCITGSSSATAFLKPQFYDPATGVYTDLASAPAGLNLAVDSSTCGFAVAGPSLSTSYALLNPRYNSSFANVEPLRIVGMNGGGVGDVPIFNNIFLQIEAPYFTTYSVCTPLGFVCPNITTLDSKTTIRFEIDTPLSINANYPYVWVSWIASE